MSNLGRIKRLKGRYVLNDRILKPLERPNGYLAISLSKENKKITKSIHRIVMTAFKGESNLTVNHIDGDKKNNTLSNLEYCTFRDNSRHVFSAKLKITNSEKFKNDILDDYRNGVTLTKLTKKYRVDLRDLKKLLLNNGFALRECRTGNYSRVINEEVIKEVCSIYKDNPNVTNREIAKLTKLSETTVGRIIKKHFLTS